MRKTVIRDGENAEALVKRLGVPLCMLLRANRLYSAAWLLPGRQIIVPESDFCERDIFPCPARAVTLPAVERRLYLMRPGETRLQAARALGAPLRLIPKVERAFSAPVVPWGFGIVTYRPGMRVDDFERSLNSLPGALFPGTQLLKKIR